jgi:hypothetical protein
MTFDLTTARRLVLKCLSQFGPGREVQLEWLEAHVAQAYAMECGTTAAPRSGRWAESLGLNGVAVVHEVVWDLIVQRVLTIRDTGSYSWAAVAVTDFGAEVLKEQRWSPYDPDGYVGELRKQAPALASLCQMYAQEALQCFRSGCYLAAVVMLGAASEGIVNELFRRFVTALKAGSVPEAASVERKIENERFVYRKYEVFRKHFDQLVKLKLPPELGDDLDLQFDGVFNLIRYYRNDAGHPTGTRIERMSAFTSLVLFVPYCKRVEDLAKWLDANSGCLNT